MKTHTKANGYFKGLCHYSKTGWAWWRYPQLGDVTTNPYCTCKPCKPPNKVLHADAAMPPSAEPLSGSDTVPAVESGSQPRW